MLQQTFPASWLDLVGAPHWHCTDERWCLDLGGIEAQPATCSPASPLDAGMRYPELARGQCGGTSATL